jgi:hypothetical protein
VRAFAPSAAIAGALLQILPGASVTGDLDGSGVPSTARVVAAGRAAEVEISDVSGRRLAASPLALAAERASSAALSTGSLGSAGALLEVAYPGGPGITCRRVFRFREGRLAALPIRGPAGPLPDCDDAAWVSRWEKPVSDAPAVWVRERSLATPEGMERDVETYAFAGFELALDAPSSRREIRGVPIPAWPVVVFYPRPELSQTLYSRLDVARLRSRPRVRIVASQAEHRFDVRVVRGSEEMVFPVCRAVRSGEDEVRLTAEAGGRTVRVRLEMGGAGEKLPVEAGVGGVGPDVDGFYVPVTRFHGEALQVYPSAEDELAVEALSGQWSGRAPGVTPVSVVSGFPAVLRFGAREVTLSIARAPEGADLLLVPVDGSPPDTAVRLIGPDRIARLPVACEGERGCRVTGGPETLRRVGSRM